MKYIKQIALIVAIVVVLILGIIFGITNSITSSASSFSGDYSDYVNLGDYIVKVDEEGAMPAMTKEQLKTAIEKCYSGQMQENCMSVLDDIVDVQNKYKVNAAFILAIAQKESTCGTNWESIDPDAHNWMSISYGPKYNGDSGKTCSGGGYTWCWYDSYNEAVQKFGIFMTEHDYFFFAHGEYSVSQIAPHFAGTEWENRVKEYLDNLYSAVAETLPQDSGVINGEKYTYAEKTYTLFVQGDYNDYYGSGETIGSAGCGVTSISIVVSGYKSGETPSTIVSKCINYGFTYQDHGVFPKYLGEYGLKGSFTSWNNQASDNIINHLKSGKPVIYNIGGTMVLNDGTTNDYSTYGHFLTLLGLDESGNIFVGDPGGHGRSNYTTIQNIANAKGNKGSYLLVDKK